MNSNIPAPSPITEEQRQARLTMQTGDIFYTKKTWKLAKSASIEFGAPLGTYFIGILIGMLPKRQEVPNKEQTLGLLADIGMIGIDDIIEALGEEEANKVIAHVGFKYNPTEETEKPQPLKIVDQNGKPL